MDSGELRSALALLEQGDWQAAHKIVQRDEDSPRACWAHGIVHMLEGDTANARYWYREAKRKFPQSASADAELRALREALVDR